MPRLTKAADLRTLAIVVRGYQGPAHGCLRLHFVAAHLVVVEAFEPAAEIFGAKGGVAVGGFAGVLVDLLGDEDGAVGTEGQGNGVGGAGVEGDHFAGLVHPDGRVEGILAEVSNDDAGDAGAEAVDDITEQVMGHGANSRGLFDFQGDGVGFKEPYPDGENDFACEIIEDDDGHLGGGIHHEATDTNFHFWFGGRMFVGFGFEAGEMHGL